VRQRTALCRITPIESSSFCYTFVTSAVPAESEDKMLSLARVLAQCPALAHLSIPATMRLVAEGVERLAGVLAKVLSAASLYKVQATAKVVQVKAAEEGGLE
jgi:hypothetical protein